MRGRSAALGTACALALGWVRLLAASCASEPAVRAPPQKAIATTEQASPEQERDPGWRVIEVEPTEPFWSPWGPTAGAQIDPRPILSWTGGWSEIRTPTYARPVSETAFARLWYRHSPLRERRANGVVTIRQDAPPPEIDFAQCTVLLVFAGDAVNSHGFCIVQADADGTRLRIRLDQRTYQSGSTAPGEGWHEARPWALFILPRTSLPIVIEEDVQDWIGRQPVWVERARL